MVESVMTLGRQVLNVYLRGSDTLPVGDHRDIPFPCDFSASAVNSFPLPGPPPQIRVVVSGQFQPHDIVVQILAPGGPPETLAATPRPGGASWSRPVAAPPTAGAAPTSPAIPGLLARMNVGWLDGGTADQGEVIGGGGGGNPAHVRILHPGTDRPGTWRVRVRNRGTLDAEVNVLIDYPEAVRQLEETRIPFELVNRAFRQAMLAMDLRFRADAGFLQLRFGDQFKRLTGIDDDSYPITDRLNDVNLVEYSLRLANRGESPAIFIGIDLEERGPEILLPFSDVNAENLVFELRLLLNYGYVKHDFFASAMRREGTRIYRQNVLIIPELDANPELHGLWASVLDYIILPVAGAFGLTPSSIDEAIADAVVDIENALVNALRPVASYVYDVIAHLAQRDHIIHSLTADGDAMIVKHHTKPRPIDFINVPAVAGTGGAVIAAAAPGTVPAAAIAAPVAAAARAPRRRAPKPRPAADERIEHIVVLMMENRSFDHMLGYRGLGDPNVNGLTNKEFNVLAQGVPPYPVYPLTQMAGIRSPRHNYHDAIAQIGPTAAMDGFVENYASLGRVDPGQVMGYYTAAELPVYEFLANNFTMLDNWHSAHPGATQCNRFCATTGRTPELDNFDIGDNRLAYFKGDSIFDALTAFGVDWVYAEGNIGFIRVFDRYRLDVQHVIPYDDFTKSGTEDTFLARVSDGRLPSVSFVDPRYIDVPPVWAANDDLPPANVGRGQQLVSRLVRALMDAPTWGKTMLLVTYDEHGGFFDHQAPYGLSPGDATPPRVHPQGADHLGVRVPAFLVSPWVNSATTDKTLFDHTSIVRTILDQFVPPNFPADQAFGARAAGANSFLANLRQNVRSDKPVPPDIPDTAFPPLQVQLHEPATAHPLERDDFHVGIRLLGIPASYRTRLFN